LSLNCRDFKYVDLASLGECSVQGDGSDASVQCDVRCRVPADGSTVEVQGVDGRS
jgi:hypothetical protein